MWRGPCPRRHLECRLSFLLCQFSLLVSHLTSLGAASLRRTLGDQVTCFHRAHIARRFFYLFFSPCYWFYFSWF